MTSHWKRKNEKPEEPEKSEALCESLENELTTCYKLMNGSKFYFCATTPPTFYGELKKKLSCSIILPLQFAGEMGNALYFFTKDIADSHTTYAFYKVVLPDYKPRFELIRTITTEKEVKFAIQQPYFLIVSENSATFESFQEDNLTLNRSNFNYLNSLTSFSFFVWRQLVHIVIVNEGKNTIWPGLNFGGQITLIGLPQGTRNPSSLYGQDNTLVFMICGSSLFIYTPNLMKIKMDLAYSNGQLAGISNRRIFMSVPKQFFGFELDEQDYKSLSIVWGHDLVKEDESDKTLKNEDTRSGHKNNAQRKITDFGTVGRGLSSLNVSSSSSSDSYQSEFLSKFTVNKILGEGGFGCLFKVTHKIDLSEYAVKRIPVAQGKLSKDLGEVRAVARLKHPGIHSTDYKISEELKSNQRIANQFKSDCVFIYIQMQLYKSSLAGWLKSNRAESSRPIRLIKSWFKQIVEAINYIHGEGMLHRDLKPGNILIDDQDQLKICDFGLVTDRRFNSEAEKSTTRTRIGSWLYASPEQSSFCSTYSSKTDVFALGLILAELCVVMTDEERGEIFDSYREGKASNGIFDAEETANFVAWLADKESKNRPTCAEILRHCFLRD